MDKFEPLRTFLENAAAKSIRVPLFYIEQMIGQLPLSALQSQDWWDEKTDRSADDLHCRVWNEVGYVATLDKNFPAVTFERK